MRGIEVDGWGYGYKNPKCILRSILVAPGPHRVTPENSSRIPAKAVVRGHVFSNWEGVKSAKTIGNMCKWR